ncbi:hypothetical protein [Roseisolibacter sp. H3M3-2]|uniref:hypothetical protein n=1 Tax=Roseisolibacter sp. H3M3-2 TaxID=3031323 RepID=UPI0023DB23EF|nr:hypothetical protein [Roseisolibacter sp. H3M3-2]MDF1503396.1 hypothetical protein [Roseisolibacter sp. H3M3-2]
MVIEREERAARAERHLREYAADARERRWFWVRTALACWVCAVPGFVCAAWAFHTTDPELGEILLDAGLVLVPAAVLTVLARAIHTAQDRGWL